MQLKFSGKQDLYIEVAERYENYIKLGVMKDGDKLPSIRVAANEYGINPNTMARAYSHLEEKGLIHTIPKKGVYVTYNGNKNSETDEERQKQNALDNCRNAVIRLKKDGITRKQIIDIIEEVYKND